MNKKDTISEFNNIFSKEVTKLLSKEAFMEANRFNDDDEHRCNQENTIYGKAIEELRILKTLFNIETAYSKFIFFTPFSFSFFWFFQLNLR